jgi:hypothetical protein
VESVTIITKVLGSNPAHGEVYLIQHYVIKFISNLRQIGGFLHPQKKCLCHDIAEISLKVALHPITLIQLESLCSTF